MDTFTRPCVECKYCIHDYSTSVNRSRVCHSPNNYIQDSKDVVFGGLIRKEQDIYKIRNNGELCGLEGKWALWWEVSKPAAVVTRKSPLVILKAKTGQLTLEDL